MRLWILLLLVNLGCAASTATTRDADAARCAPWGLTFTGLSRVAVASAACVCRGPSTRAARPAAPTCTGAEALVAGLQVH
jgi:hypothetical protein